MQLAVLCIATADAADSRKGMMHRCLSTKQEATWFSSGMAGPGAMLVDDVPPGDARETVERQVDKADDAARRS